MSDTINDSVTQLKAKKVELINELNRVDQAIKALENLGGVESKSISKRKGVRLKCQNVECGRMFYARRKDAKFCNPGHAPAYIKRLKNPDKSKTKPVTLIRGDNLSTGK